MYVQLFFSFNNNNKKNADRNEKKKNKNKIWNNYTKENFFYSSMFYTNLDAPLNL